MNTKPPPKPPFEVVVTTHGSTVLRVTRGVLGAGPDADDAWSETFLAALTAWPGLPADANAQAWLVTIAHRKCIDILRRRARHAVPVEHLPETRGPGGSGLRGAASAASDPAASVEYIDLYAALACLPEKQRLAVAYHHLGGLAYTEVAEVLGGRPDAARRAAADGMRSLRRHLGARQDDE